MMDVTDTGESASGTESSDHMGAGSEQRQRRWRNRADHVTTGPRRPKPRPNVYLALFNEYDNLYASISKVISDNNIICKNPGYVSPYRKFYYYTVPIPYVLKKKNHSFA